MFEGVDSETGQLVALKVLYDWVPELLVKREIKALKTVAGAPGVVGLIDIVRNPRGNTTSPTIVMELGS